MEASVEQALSAIGHSRQAVVRVSTVLLIPYLVAGSTHLATLPTWLSRHFATYHALDVSPVPFELPEIESRMMWHERTHRLGLFIWLRELIRTIVPGLVTTGTDLRTER
jgi:DNA-binding transcriptional LysR family regulator